MAELYCSKPFISHAGADSEGFRAEVLVTKGVGNVKSIEKNDRTAKVTIDVPSLSKPVQAGWINIDSDAFRLLKERQEAGLPVAFRIEHQRRPKNSDTGELIDKKTPFYELVHADKNGSMKNSMAIVGATTKKLLVGVGVPDGEMKFIQEQTDPSEDPQYGSSAPSARLQNAARKKNGDVVVGDDAGVRATRQYHTGGFHEVQPWYAQNPTGEVNPGSYAVEAELDFYFWVLEYASKHELKDLGDHRAKMLASYLVRIADSIQLSIYDGRLDEPDRNISSYGRVRWIIRRIVETVLPLTDDDLQKPATIKAWLKKVGDEAEKLWRWSIEDYAKELGVEPYGPTDITDDESDGGTDESSDDTDADAGHAEDEDDEDF